MIDGLLKEVGNAALEEEDVLSTVFTMIVGLLEDAGLPLVSFNMTGVLLEEEDGFPTLVNRIVGLLEEAFVPFVSFNLTGVLLAEESDLALIGESDRTDVLIEEEEDVLPIFFNRGPGLLG